MSDKMEVSEDDFNKCISTEASLHGFDFKLLQTLCLRTLVSGQDITTGNM